MYQVASSITSAYSSYEKGKMAKAQGKYTALQHYNNARQRMLAGVQESQNIKAKGREGVSGAKVAMIGQGGTIDSVMLAKLKRESEIDAISAMYDAKADALKSRSAGRMAELGADQKYRAEMMKMGSSLLDAGTYSYNQWSGKKSNRYTPDHYGRD